MSGKCLPQKTRGGGVNSKKGCFRRKTKFFRESDDFAGNRESWKIFREKQSNEVKILGIVRFLLEFLPKYSGQYSKFSGGLLFQSGTTQTAFVRAVTPTLRSLTRGFNNI